MAAGGTLAWMVPASDRVPAAGPLDKEIIRWFGEITGELGIALLATMR